MKAFVDGPFVEPFVWNMTDRELNSFIDGLVAMRYQQIEESDDLPFDEDYWRTLLDDCGSHGLFLQSVEHEFLKYLNSAACRMKLGIGPECEQLRLVATRGGTEFKWGKFLYPGVYNFGEARRVQKLTLKCCKTHSISVSRSLGGVMWNSDEMQSASVRDTSSVERAVRNINPSNFVKDLYSGQCQKCQIVLQTPNGPIAEAAHIIEVQSGGSDEISNLLCLCPNCHKAFDANAWAPVFVGTDLVAVSYDNSEDIQVMVLLGAHQVARKAIDWRLGRFLAA